jgi:hypothetical protein
VAHPGRFRIRGDPTGAGGVPLTARAAFPGCIAPWEVALNGVGGAAAAAPPFADPYGVVVDSVNVSVFA